MHQTFFLVALSFANPALLWALGAASLPIIIHLLNRRRFREERWAAMRFLLAAIRKNQRRVRLEQWILLAVRTLIVLLIVSALAKPLLERAGILPLLAGQRTHWVLVLDGSMSMDYRVGEQTRFDEAKAIAKRLVKDARQGDGISLIMMAEPPRVVIGAPVQNADAVAREIDSLLLAHGGVDLAATFTKVNEVLAASSMPRKDVVVISDLQAASWRRAGKADESLNGLFAKLDEHHARSLVIDLGAADEPNRAVVDMRIDPPLLVLGRAATVRATIRNFGREPAPGTRVRLIVGDRISDERTVNLNPGESMPLAYTLRPESAGESVVAIALGDDNLRPDDTRRVAAPVREALSVLLVDGDPRAEVYRSETDYLATVLHPEVDDESAAGPGSPFKIEVVPESELIRRDLVNYDVVALCNVAQVTAGEVAALDRFAQLGGGVVVFGGDQVQADNYNRLLFANGKGLLPARIDQTIGDPAAGSSFEFNALGFRHPIVADFAGQAEPVVASLTSVKTFRYHKLTLPKESQAKVALGFNTSAPAVIEAARGRGRVFQIATSADRDWTSWPLHQSYPPVMEQIVIQAASGRFSDRNVQVGQPLVQSFPPSAAGAAVSLAKPGGAVISTKLSAAKDESVFRFDDTDRAGAYSVSIGAPVSARETFAANPDPAESDPAKLDQAALKQALPGWTFDYDNDWRGLEKSASSVAQRGELHRPLLWSVLALLLIESLLAFWFGHHSFKTR